MSWNVVLTEVINREDFPKPELWEYSVEYQTSN